MNDKDKNSALKAWLLILASFADEAILLVLLFATLKVFRVDITWPVILVAVLGVVAYFIIMHKAVVPALRRRRTTGSEGMIGRTGKVSRALKPQGVVKIGDEYWEAKSVQGDIQVNEKAEVVGIRGLMLEVKRKEP